MLGWHGQMEFVRVELARYCLRIIHFEIWIDNTSLTIASTQYYAGLQNTDKHRLVRATSGDYDDYVSRLLITNCEPLEDIMLVTL